MKKLLSFLFLLWGISVTQGVYATHIVRAPGSTIDIFNEIPIGGILTADTIFIEGGTGDITLQAGATDNSVYDWNIGTGSLTTFTVTFTYANATVTLSDGSKGRLVSCARDDTGVQYVWVVYRALPLKPTTPSGSTSVCAGTSTSYTSSSTNATGYQWYIDPSAAGTLSNATSATVTVNWTAGWTGDAELTVEGTKDATTSPLSDPLTVTVNDAPGQASITGDSFVKKGSSSVYTGTASNTPTSWSWFLNPTTGIATSTPSGDGTTLNFSATGNLTLTAQAHNGCGDGSISNDFAIEIVDVDGLQAENTQLKIDTATYRQQVRDSTTVINSLRTDVANLKIDTTLFASLVRFYRNDSIPELHGIITTVTGERDQALADNLVLQGQVDDLKIDTTLIRSINRYLEFDSIPGLHDSIAGLNLDITNLQNAYDQVVADSALAGANYRDSIGVLLDSIDYINSTNNTTLYLDSISELNTIIDGLVIQINDSTAVINSLRADIDQIIADSTATGIAYRDSIATLNLNITNLQSAYDQVVADSTAAGIAYRDSIATLNLNINTLTTQVDDLTTQVATLTANNTALQNQVNDLTNRIDGIATLLDVDESDIENQISILSQVYILSWEVTGVYTSVFETEIGTFEISLYPNPSPGEVFVKCDNIIQTIAIYDMQGSLIQQFDNINSTETSFIITRADMPVGTYIVRITNNQGQYTTNKIIFQ